MYLYDHALETENWNQLFSEWDIAREIGAKGWAAVAAMTIPFVESYQILLYSAWGIEIRHSKWNAVNASTPTPFQRN